MGHAMIIVAATACLVPFLLESTPALRRQAPEYMVLQCLGGAAASLLGLCAVAPVCIRVGEPAPS